MDETAFEIETLHVGDTKPALVPFVNIPVELASLLIVGSFAVANLFHAALLGLGTGAILAGFASLLTRRDYNGIRIFGIYTRLCSLWLSAHRLGGLSVNHFPPRRRTMTAIADEV